MNKTKIAALAVCMTFLLSACGKIGKPDPNTITRLDQNDGNEDAETTDTEVVPIPYSPIEDTNDYVETLMSRMTVEQKVGQLFFVRPDALETAYENSVVCDDSIGGVTYVDKMMAEALEKYPVGGIHLYEKNIVDPQQLSKLTNDLQECSAFPLFIGVNELGGDYAPVANNINFDVPMFDNLDVIGKTGSMDKAKTLGSSIGGYLTEYGINLDFAPCADISDDAERVIGKNFSNDAVITTNMAAAEVEGFHESGVMTAANHFPGYGDGNADGDTVYINESSWEELQDREILAFSGLLQETDMLVVGHIEMPNAVSDGFPASMSHEFISDKLRDELKYYGIVITDSQSAAAVRNNYVQVDTALGSFMAGADMILEPYDLAEAYDSILQAVNDGTITQERLDVSVKRILKLKAENGLFGV